MKQNLQSRNLAFDKLRHVGSGICLAIAIVLSTTLTMHASGAQAESAMATQRYSLCATSPLAPRMFPAIGTMVRDRLNAIPGISKARVAPSSSHCMSVIVTASANERSAVRASGRSGTVVLANSARTFLAAGTHVQLVCTHPHCSPGVNIGVTSAKARPPRLGIVVPAGGVQPGSASAQAAGDGKWQVTYALRPSATNVWCSFTTHHVSRYVAIVVDGTVLIDPVIQSAICGGQIAIAGILDKTRAHEIAGYLNTGPLPVVLRLRP